MNISVIVPTLNAEKKIVNLINSLHKQIICPNEIIIIDSSSDDNTVSIAGNLGCKTVIIKRTAFDHGGTRNYGAKLATGDILIFLTQDAVPYDNLLIEKLTSPLLDSLISASYARQVANADANPPEQFSRQFNYPSISSLRTIDDLPTMGIKTFFFSNVCAAIKRQAFEDAGGFPERIIMNEDMFLAANILLSGNKIAYCHNAMVWHSHNYSITEYFKRYFDIGAALSMNGWILNCAKAEGEGIKFAIEQFKYLIFNHHSQWIPYALSLLVAKYLGFRLGLIHSLLPTKCKYILSLNKIFWKSEVTHSENS